MEIYRGLRLPKAVLDLYENNIGKLCLWPSFQSYTLSEPVAVIFAERGAEGLRVIFRLESQGRPHIQGRSRIAGEKEVLLPACSIAQVIGVGHHETAVSIIRFRDFGLVAPPSGAHHPMGPFGELLRKAKDAERAYRSPEGCEQAARMLEDSGRMLGGGDTQTRWLYMRTACEWVGASP
jgi:hypothetical protein